MPYGPARPASPPDVAAFIAKSRIPRARAAKKVQDVLRRAAAGGPDLDPIREIWAFGSFARGAATVGDVDLYILVDESSDERGYAYRMFLERRRPFAAQAKALGCSGASIVDLQAYPVFDAPGEPASPERLATLDEAASAGVVPASAPVLTHVVTGERLAGPFVLLWARGDRLEWALERLIGIAEHPRGARHERTTSVPLLDDFTHKLGLVTAFGIAARSEKATSAAARSYSSRLRRLPPLALRLNAATRASRASHGHRVPPPPRRRSRSWTPRATICVT
jgi:hypothetical protein